METKIIKRGFGNTAGKVTCVRAGDGMVYLFGVNPTDHSRDVKPAGRWVHNSNLDAVVFETVEPKIEEGSIPCNPIIWKTEQADWQPVNWITIPSEAEVWASLVKA